MLSADIEKHLSTLLENRPKHHGLWDGNGLVCASENLERIAEIKKKGIENISDADVVFLFTGADSNVGTKQTFHFFLPDFFRLLFFKREFGYSTDVEDIFDRLDEYNFRDWPSASQAAVLKLCEAGAKLEQIEHVDFFDEENKEINDLIGRIKSSREQLGA